MQMLVLDDGRTFPSFFKMFEEGHIVGNSKMITEIDLFFPDKKVAVFCDSYRFHRTATSLEKDKKIDEFLEGLGIKSLRIHSSEIFNDMDTAIGKILSVLN